MTRICLISILMFIPWMAKPQAKRALNQMEKLKYDQAEELLYRSIGKDSINPGEKYVLSLLYFTEDYYNYNVDSAYLYSLSAIRDFENSDDKAIEKLAKDEIFETDLIYQKNRVEEFTFKLAREQNDEDGYKNYLEKYKASNLYDSAVWYRNKVAFEDASKTDTWQSYQSFMLKYPEADQFQDARERYDKLIFNDKTGDGKLSSYVNFLKEFPETPY